MPDTTTLRGIEQGRADYAYKCAKEEGLPINVKKENAVLLGTDYYADKQYKAYAKKIPMLVKSNGLGATFAFILSKKTKEKKGNNGQMIKAGDKNNPKNAYDLLYKQTAEWINRTYPFIDATHAFDYFSDFIITRESTQYRAITVEVLSFFTWLRRFAEGLIESEDEQDS